MTTPLHEAVRAGDLRWVAELLEHGSDVNIADTTGKTPIWYVFDSVETGREPVDTAYYLYLALVKRGADPNDLRLREWLSTRLDGLRGVDIAGIRIQMGLPMPLTVDELESPEEPIVRRTADDTPVRLCDWALTENGYCMWVIAHPDVRATGETVDDALDDLIEATLEQLNDFEPNIHFVRPPPELRP